MVLRDVRMSEVTATAGVAYELLAIRWFGAQAHGAFGICSTRVEGALPTEISVSGEGGGSPADRYTAPMWEAGMVARFSPTNNIHFWLDGAYPSANDLVPTNRESRLISRTGIRFGGGLGFYF